MKDFLDRVEGFHDKVAESAELPSVVHCHECGLSLDVDPAECLRYGWPRCSSCGMTMTVDPPRGQS